MIIIDFEWYYPNSEMLQVSISDSAITFYNETVQVMNSPQYVLLGYNEDNKIIGVKACETPEDNCLEFDAKKRNGYVRINDKKFIRFIESRIGDTLNMKGKQKRYPAKWDNEQNILYVYLEKAIS